MWCEDGISAAGGAASWPAAPDAPQTQNAKKASRRAKPRAAPLPPHLLASTSDRPVRVAIAHGSHELQAFRIGDQLVGIVELQRRVGDSVELAAGRGALELRLVEIEQLQKLVVDGRLVDRQDTEGRTVDLDVLFAEKVDVVAKDYVFALGG